MNFPWFRGHPRSHESAVGVVHGQAQEAAFTKELKAEAVRVVQASGKTVWAVARELDLTETALREWVRQTEIDAGRGQPGALTTDERAELAQLRREAENSRH